MTGLKTQCVFLFKNQEKFVIQIKWKKMWDLFLNSSVKKQLIHTAKLGSIWYACSVANQHFKPNEQQGSSNCQAKCNSLVEKVNRRNKVKTFSGAIVNQIKNSIKALS